MENTAKSDILRFALNHFLKEKRSYL